VAQLQPAVFKLGQRAVVCDKNGNPKVVSAKYLIRAMRKQKEA